MKIWTGFCLFLTSLFSCQQQGADFKIVSVDEFAALIADPNVQCLDVRTVAEYSEGHIRGSININVLEREFESVADSVLDKTKPVALYCRSGRRSKKAASILAAKGYKIYDLARGITGWEKSGKSTER